MSKVIMQVSPLPTFMMNALQEADYLVHDHTYIKDPDALSKVTALIGVSADAKVDRRLLSMLPNLKMIALCGVGYDGLDLDAILAKNIVVTNTPGVMCDDVADLAMGLVLAVGRRIAQADRFMRNGDWVDEPFPMTQRVSGACLGIVGMGRVGRAVAQRAKGFDMQVSYTDHAPKPNVSHTFVADVKVLAAQVDYLVVAVPLMEATKNLINAEVLQALGPKGYLVNVAHGAVIDQPALVQALKDKAIAGAGLDVFWDEPRIEPELRRMTQVVCTPHMGAGTEETRRAMAELALANLNAFFDVRPVLTPIQECQVV
jgi:hydroxypyruvate reductase